MTHPRTAGFDAVRPIIRVAIGMDMTPGLVRVLDTFADAAGVPKVPASGQPTGDVTIAPWPQMLASITNRNAPALLDGDFIRVAAELGVSPAVIRAVRKVEAPRGPFDDQGRPSILYERHVFARNTAPEGRFNASHPDLSANSGYGAGGYGAYSAQIGKLERAYALDAEAAFCACSWGAFQVLGENAQALGYGSARGMAVELAKSEAAHLDSFARFVRVNALIPALQQCRAGDPASCVPFVSRYNGKGYAQFSYHTKLAAAIAEAAR